MQRTRRPDTRIAKTSSDIGSAFFTDSGSQALLSNRSNLTIGPVRVLAFDAQNGHKSMGRGMREDGFFSANYKLADYKS